MTLTQLEQVMLDSRRRYVEAADRATKPLDGQTRLRLAQLLSQAHFARDTWEIARDHGLAAALLFKLSDGAADPRYPDHDQGR